MQKNLKQALEFTQKNKGNFQPRFRLNYHLMAPLGWINDPNGLVFFNGEYHAFYQHHPYDKDWGPMHWGHSKSKDMVHWEHLPIALAPGDECDKGGCYSGSAVDNDGELTLIYTGHIFDDPNNRDPFSPDFHQNQNIAYSEDGITFTKYEKNPVIVAPPADNTQNFRDPKVWLQNGEWNMVVGSTSKEDIGRTILYRSKDLKEWNYIGVLATSNGELGSMWECPDFFELDGTYVQVFSPVGMNAEGRKYKNVFQTGTIIGEYDYAANQFNHGEFEELDRGHDFYAMQTFTAEDGRRIGIGWMNMWQTPMPEKEDNWAGAFTVPRELHVVNNRVQMTPINELASLRSATLLDKTVQVEQKTDIMTFEENSAEILLKADLTDVQDSQIGFELVDQTGVVASFSYNQSKQELVFQRQGEDGERSCEVASLKELALQIYLDKSSIEIFVNNGLEVFTSRIYPTGGCKLVAVNTKGSLEANIVVYKLGKVIE